MTRYRMTVVLEGKEPEMPYETVCEGISEQVVRFIQREWTRRIRVILDA